MNKLNVVLTEQELYLLEKGEWHVFNNQLVKIENFTVLDYYEDVLNGVPEVINCRLVEVEYKDYIFSFGT